MNNTDERIKEMVEALDRPKARPIIFKHFKSGYYQLDSIAENAETGETMVVYHSLSDPGKIWVRSWSNFTEKLDPKKYPDVTQPYRFVLSKINDYHYGMEIK